MSEGVWRAVLDELRVQMTQATFNTWVADTQLVSHDDGLFVVGVPSAHVKGWLEDRLGLVVERTLLGILGYPCQVKFVVKPGVDDSRPSGPGLVHLDDDPHQVDKGVVMVRLYEYNPMERGWLMMPKYCEFFWQPYLGGVAYATYRFFRSLDRQNEGWGKWHSVSVDRIAATVADSRRQAITGVQRRRKGSGEKYWQEGAFDRLEAAAIAKIERLGSGRNLSYRVLCLNSLPLLTPQQVETLPLILQEAHAKFLGECDIEYQEWEQLELPTLVRE